ncbi:MAG TPA: beta-ketoacyl synthase N-terminal-like domain-containing protein, partial [Thermoanaerobaculia bacterium]|nr:beta-ketoacyl synthase N-terminal-like domain-containing protein [Thermoanaerobaculia bacterium]
MTGIPITGIGVVAPGAIGVDAFRRLLASGETALSDVDRFDVEGLRSRKAGLVCDFKPKDFIAPMKMRRMNGLSRFAVAAAKLAIDDCGGAVDADTGVAMGTAFGPVQTSVEYMHEYVEKGAALAPPQLFAESVANAPGSHIAIEWGLRGFNVTITQRESSALAAAMYASAQLLKGAARGALIGGVEEVNEMLFSVLDRLGGVTIGEGGAVLVAGGGTRKPYAALSGFGIARDTTASISDWGDDANAVVTAMRAAMDDAEVDAVDAIYVSANGNARADALEARALASLFGERVPRIATKPIFGEYAAGGVLQLVAAILDVERSSRRVLVNSLSAGGG